MDSLDRAPKGVNCIQYMPTASLMTYVMGLEAAKTRPATEAERAEMARLLDEGMDAGLCGFSIQRLGPNIRRRPISTARRWSPTPCATRTSSTSRACCVSATKASWRSRRRTGQSRATTWISSSGWRTIAQRPILFQAVTPTRNNPEIHRRSLRWIERKARAKGLPIFGQGGTVRSGFAFTLEHWNLYDTLPAWRELTTGTKEEKLAKMRDPATARGGHPERTTMRRQLQGDPGMGRRLIRSI